MRDLLDRGIEDKLGRYEGLLSTLEIIAGKELTKEPLTESEYEAIWKIGAVLESVTRFPHKITSGIRSATDDNMAVIADVHTDPNSGQVLEEAVGFPSIIYVKGSVEGKDQVVQGPVFSYYEFKQPMSERLTDEQWQQMLEKGREPPLPRWSSTFTVKQ